MRRRKRLLTSILALVAMTFSLAETVAASVCSPGMAMAAEVHDVDPVHGDHAMPAGTHHGEQGAPEEGDTQCPFGPAVAGCAGVASFPAQVSSDFGPLSHADTAAFAEPTQQHLLLVSHLFRPPRS